MRRAIIILVIVAVVIASAVFACNSGKGKSTNNEGLVAATSPPEAVQH